MLGLVLAFLWVLSVPIIPTFSAQHNTYIKKTVHVHATVHVVRRGFKLWILKTVAGSLCQLWYSKVILRRRAVGPPHDRVGVGTDGRKTLETGRKDGRCELYINHCSGDQFIFKYAKHRPSCARS